MSSETVQLRRLSDGDPYGLFAQVAVLHATLIHGGLLPLLGERFLANLYREIAKSPYGSVHMAVGNVRVIGFVAGASDIRRCALSFTPLGYIRLISILCSRVWRRGVMGKVVHCLAYPFRKPAAAQSIMTPPGKHRAELLAIAVCQSAQGTGVGKALVRAFEETLRGSTDHYFVATNAVQTESNAFYSKLGFTKAGQQRYHNLLIQIYKKSLN
jgi:ribosomal protein S18 acetylase RimI-like enzyme